jgi:hypothetical protein
MAVFEFYFNGAMMKNIFESETKEKNSSKKVSCTIIDRMQSPF